MNRRKKPTYYELLEISPDAPQHEIVAAYRRAKETYSPNSPALYTMFSAEEANELLQLIEEAYLTLNNQITRHEYDMTLGAEKVAATAGGADLPDFTSPVTIETTDDSNPAVSRPAVTNSTPAAPSNPAPAPAQEVPSGFAKTKYGVYEVNEELEAEIEALNHVDGPFIQKVRSYKGINIEQLSQETRISRSYIRAIEANDYEALPARVFLRGFLIQIAKVIGLEGQKAATSYLDILNSNSE